MEGIKEIIRVEGINKRFGDIQALQQISFSVKEGEIFGFLGPNGAGKTTTIKILSGLLKPDSGLAFINGFNVASDSLRAKESVGVVPESSNLYNELTARENLIYMAQLYGVPKKEWKIRSEDLLREFNLLNRADTKFQGFSRGLKRRLTIAAALVHHPRLLFLDEPTTGLDVMSARGLRGLVKKLKENGVTIFLTTHLIGEAEELCDRVAIIVNGQIRIIDTPQALKERAQDTEVIEVRLKPLTLTITKELASMAGVEKVTIVEDRLVIYGKTLHDCLASIINRLDQGGRKIFSIQTLTPTLEDAFVKLTGVDAEVMRLDKPMKIGSTK